MEQTKYVGKYVYRRESDGLIDGVQVEDTGGQSMYISPAIYELRGIKPPLEQLPDQNSINP